MKEFSDNEQSFKQYYELFEKWNSKISLMAVSDYLEFVNKHVLDSLECLPSIAEAKSLLDLGTGGGFPGIPIKIARPDLEVVVLDATRKKVSFCEEVIRDLGLQGIDAVWGRAEDEGVIKGLGAFDAVISRATWELKDYLKFASVYVSVGGIVVSMKGSNWDEEFKAAEGDSKLLNLELKSVYEYSLVSGEKRAVIVFKRTE